MEIYLPTSPASWSGSFPCLTGVGKTFIMNYPFDHAAIWVGCLASYNAGNLIGKWFRLDDYADEDDFMAGIATYFEELDESHPLDFGQTREEWQFNDWEFIPDFFISEYDLDKAYWLLRDKLKEESEDRQDAFFLFAAHYGYNNISEENFEDIFESFEVSYQGHYPSCPMESFAHDEAERRFWDSFPDAAKQYFNYRSFEIDLSHNGYWDEDGHVFAPV